VFEWGSGGSTLFFAERVAQVITVENVAAWQDEIRGYAEAAELTNIRHILVEWEKGQPHRREMLHAYCHSIDGFPDDYFDLVFSDGWDISRAHCPQLAAPKVKPGGWLVTDDYGWHPVNAAAAFLKDSWELVPRGGVIDCAWDGQPRNNVTAFWRKPG
jgi:predicted O-methyltransferase YrrM